MSDISESAQQDVDSQLLFAVRALEKAREAIPLRKGEKTSEMAILTLTECRDAIEKSGDVKQAIGFLKIAEGALSELFAAPGRDGAILEIRDAIKRLGG